MAGGGGQLQQQARQVEPVPHPPKDQLPNVSTALLVLPHSNLCFSKILAGKLWVSCYALGSWGYAFSQQVESRNWPDMENSSQNVHPNFFGPAEAILLGFQHYLVMLGTIVIIPTALVPQMGGGNEEKAQVIPNIAIRCWAEHLVAVYLWDQTACCDWRVLYAVAPTISIILSGQWRFKKIMRATQGALIVASTLQIVLGFSGLWRNVTRFLSPLSAVPLVSLVGFGLYEFGFPGVSETHHTCIDVHPMMIVESVSSLFRLPNVLKLGCRASPFWSFLSGKNIFDRFAVIFTVIIVWIYAHLLTVGGAYNGKPPKTQASCRTDRAGLIDGLVFLPIQWGPPSFNAGEAFAMMMASFVALVGSTGCFYCSCKICKCHSLPPSMPVVVLVGRELEILLTGLFGTRIESSVSVENAGLLALTRVGSRRVVQISAAFMIFFSILAPLLVLCIAFLAYVGAGGLGFLQFCNLNSFRTKFILGFSVFLACPYHSTSMSILLLLVMDLFTHMQDGSMTWPMCPFNGFCGWCCGFFPRQHDAQGRPGREKTEASTGGTNSSPSRLTTKIRILPPFQSEQVFPICVIW
ncbi:hypothetical protein HAX54_032636 [Datura stramonium]|uniref:Uncharacterized protein n=1 Tax=Datura stramonium TaxID=4076 RepID=A0ABS8VD67_DATST|nr:hypothetical protein [Datura stramonium]